MTTYIDAVEGEVYYIFVSAVDENIALAWSTHYVLELREWEEETGQERCNDGIDNDGDGLRDWSAPGCGRE